MNTKAKLDRQLKKKLNMICFFIKRYFRLKVNKEQKKLNFDLDTNYMPGYSHELKTRFGKKCSDE